MRMTLRRLSSARTRKGRELDQRRGRWVDVTFSRRAGRAGRRDVRGSIRVASAAQCDSLALTMVCDAYHNR
jgi:hypothetical protein